MDAACINDCYLKQLEAEFLYKGRTFVRILSPARVALLLSCNFCAAHPRQVPHWRWRNIRE
jgi:hypothetical protein